MTTLLRRLLCLLFGHPDSRLHWGAWQDDPEVGRHRVLTENCVRCRAVVSLASLLESDRPAPSAAGRATGGRR